ncbi:Shedu immune nuclease family protein [Bosea sp. TAF32]|uniref:Shedu immune nuclease family protein n=1 Tax=Bosea sp. TAF32 TaxID=3237482 RepID=UPI003F904437
MARIIPGITILDDPKFDFKPGKNGTWQVLVTPADRMLASGGLDLTKIRPKPIHMLTIDEKRKRFSVHPYFTRPTPTGLFERKYENIKTISFDITSKKWKDGTNLSSDSVYSLLGSMPDGMIFDPNFGLGIKRDYRFILKAIGELSKFSSLYIGVFEPDADEFFIQSEDFDSIVAEINRIDSRARAANVEVKATTTYNFIAELEGFPPRHFKLGRHAIRQLITKFIKDTNYVDGDIANEQISVVAKTARRLAKDNLSASVEIVSKIQISRLEAAIAQYEGYMESGEPERVWQKFFEDDPFLLSFAFGYPVAYVNGQSHVGGKRIGGKGENIADFLYKNAMNNNAAIIEIKTPQTPLLGYYRQSSLHPHKELSGAVIQVLNQKYNLARTFPTKRDDNEWYGPDEVRDFDLDCVVVVGTMPTDVKEQRSFQLYRKNSHGVRIITFDELLENLKNVLHYMKDSDNETIEGDDDEPEDEDARDGLEADEIDLEADIDLEATDDDPF